MAKKVTVTLVDDFDGSGAADETVEFGLDGVTYEIDLSTKNATKLRGDLKQWVAAGRRVRWRRTDGRSAPETLGWFSRLSPMRFCSTATWGAAPRNRPGTARLGTLAGRPLQWTAGTRCRPLYPMVRESR